MESIKARFRRDWKELTESMIDVVYAAAHIVGFLVAFSVFVMLLALLVTFVIGCSGAHQRTAANASRTILIETSLIFADIDRMVARSAEQHGEEAIERAAERFASDNGCQQDGETPDVCITRLVQEEMAPWYRLTRGLEMAYEALEAWEIANDDWAEDGERPPDWNRRVCIPMTTLSQSILDAAREAGVSISSAWLPLPSYMRQVCRLGVEVAGNE